MIEISLEGLQHNFFAQAEQFLAEPTVLNGIEFDDATVKLKRLLLSRQSDHPAIPILNRFTKLIRQKDVDGLQDHLADLRNRIG